MSHRIDAAPLDLSTSSLGALLRPEERDALETGQAPVDVWLLGAGHLLRTIGPGAELRRELRARCRALAVEGLTGDVDLLVEQYAELLDAASHEVAEDNAKRDPWALLAMRDDAESLRWALEEVERGERSDDAASDLATTLDELTGALATVDENAVSHEDLLLDALRRTPDDDDVAAVLAERASMTDDGWWSRAARAAIARTQELDWTIPERPRPNLRGAIPLLSKTRDTRVMVSAASIEEILAAAVDASHNDATRLDAPEGVAVRLCLHLDRRLIDRTSFAALRDSDRARTLAGLVITAPKLVSVRLSLESPGDGRTVAPFELVAGHSWWVPLTALADVSHALIVVTTGERTVQIPLQFDDEDR